MNANTSLYGFNNSFAVGDKRIGLHEPCFVIAEAGSNHNKDFATAKRLIDIAAEAGADAVKFQLFAADSLYPRAAGKPRYLNDEEDIFAVIAAMELPHEWLIPLRDYAKQAHLLFLATPFDFHAVELLAPLVDIYKIASYELRNHALVKRVAQEKKPILLSTGACTETEVAETVGLLADLSIKDLVLLQCTACYPAPLSELSLRAVPYMHQRFGVPAGLSDHSAEPTAAPCAALAAGACVIEKHFTYDKTAKGPDHKFALNPAELKAMIRAIRETECILGRFEKTVAPCEQELRSFTMPALFARSAIAQGELFTDRNVIALRRGNTDAELEAKHLPTLQNKAAQKSYQAQEPISKGELQ